MKELNNFRQFLTEGKEDIKEGTWSLGSVAEMALALGELEKIRKMGRMKGSMEINRRDDMFYNVFGDDSFHDALDAAKMATDDDVYNNMIGDAQARGIELYNDEIAYRKERGETGTEFKPRFGLEENDSVLDEIIGEEEEKEEVNEAPAVFAEIDEMIETLATHMSAEDVLKELMSELQIISGGTKALHSALKNIMIDADLMEAKKDEE